MPLYQILLPEILLVTAACVLFLLGFVAPRATGRTTALVALCTVLAALVISIVQYSADTGGVTDTYQSFRTSPFSHFVRVLALSIAPLLILLNWPGNRDGTGNSSVHWGRDSGEFFGLLLLSFTGLIMVPAANDLIVLFMAIELASIPTYILVSVSRPLTVAQEAGVKYFFLGAMAAAVLLMGFGYLYGVTGTTNLHEMARLFERLKPGATDAPTLTSWQLLAGVFIVIGLAFKLAAVPMHAYVADVYQGAATSITAVLGFVPKTVGIIALIKILFVLAGGHTTWAASPQMGKLIWILAVLTMTIGNLLALTQTNVKRMFAYSSVAHSGYLLAGVALVMLGVVEQRVAAVQSVLFYLAIYGVTSTAAFGALQLIPSRQVLAVGGEEIYPPATTAETFDDLAGFGRAHPVIGLLLAIACFSLVGLPLTGGFWGKYYLIVPALTGQHGGVDASGWVIALAIIVILNSALSAAYYLGVVGALFNRAEPAYDAAPRQTPMVVSVGVGLCVALVLILGTVLTTTDLLAGQAANAAQNLDTGSRNEPSDRRVARLD